MTSLSLNCSLSYCNSISPAHAISVLGENINLRGNRFFPIKENGKQNRVSIDESGEITIKSKSPAEIAGERILKPIVDKACSLWNTVWLGSTKVSQAITNAKNVAIKTYKSTCVTDIVVGIIGTTLTKNPIPLSTTTLACLLTSAKAENTNIAQALVKILDQSGEYSQALKICDRFITQKQHQPQAYYCRGIALKRLGNIQQAYEAFKKASELDKNLSNTKEVNELEDLMHDENRLRNYRKTFLSRVKVNVPSHYDYGIMSALVRDPKSIERMESISSQTNADQAGNVVEQNEFIRKLKSQDWVVHTTTKKLKIANKEYYAAAFKNRVTNDIIIAHGSWGKNDYSLIDHDLEELKTQSDPFTSYYNEAYKFTQEVEKISKGCVISHAGTSFGASIAEKLAFSRHEIAVTFDGEGIKSKVVLHQNPLHIISYLTFPNLINTRDDHIGLYRMIKPINIKGYPEQFWDSFKDLFSAKKRNRELENHHDIFNILKTFNPDTGKPKTFRYIVRWPKGDTERESYKKLTSYGEGPLDENIRKQLNEIYSTTQPSEERVPLSHFDKDTQLLLKQCQNGIKYYSNLSRRILMMYEYDEKLDEIVMKSDPEVFSVQDFENYIKHKKTEIRNKGLVLLKANELPPDEIEKLFMTQGSSETTPQPFALFYLIVLVPSVGCFLISCFCYKDRKAEKSDKKTMTDSEFIGELEKLFKSSNTIDSITYEHTTSNGNTSSASFNRKID